MKFAVQITDCGPLSFRDGRETFRATSLDYVPGSVLLGVLATIPAQLHNNAQERDAIFFGKQSGFGNLYPSRFEQEDLKGDMDPVYPIPATAVSCKRFPGFRFDETDADQPHHGVRDTVIPWTLFCLGQRSRIDVLQPLSSCPHEGCNQPLDRFSGFYRRDPFDVTILGKASVQKGLRTRTGIDRSTGSVHQRILYSRETLQPNMTFWGTATVPDECADGFEAFVQAANASGLLRLGNNRTRGFGSATLQVDRIEDEDVDSLRQNIRTFNDELRTQAKRYAIDTPHKLYLPLTLISDVILYDRLLRQRTKFDTSALADLGIERAELIYRNSNVRQVMGWNSLWRVPKADDTAITMGSVFVFGLSQELNDDLLQVLLRMQRSGIGVRRREGFGQLLVANPFHWEVNE